MQVLKLTNVSMEFLSEILKWLTICNREMNILLQFGFDVCLFVRLLLGHLWTDWLQTWQEDWGWVWKGP